MQDLARIVRTARAGRLVALMTTLVVVAAVGGARPVAADDGGIGIAPTLSPSVVPQGAEALWHLEVSNDTETATLTDVTLDLEIDSGAVWDLKAMKLLNGNLCSASKTSESGNEVHCRLGDISGGQPFEFDAVINTSAVSPPSDGDAFPEMNAHADGSGETFGNAADELVVSHSDPESFTGYAPPGGTVFLGPKTPDASDPTVASVKLPKKISSTAPAAVLAQATSVTSPGAVISLTADLPENEPAVCAGQNCVGRIINLATFSGYNDKKHPVIVTLSWAGSPLLATSKLYTIKGGLVVLTPACTKNSTGYTNTPCLVKEKVKKKTGQTTDTVAVLSGDPGWVKR